MRAFDVKPKRVVVEVADNDWRLGNLCFSTIDGKFVCHLDGECTNHSFDADQVEFLEDEN